MKYIVAIQITFQPVKKTTRNVKWVLLWTRKRIDLEKNVAPAAMNNDTDLGC